ncbi:hypothetical protein M3Y99_01892400 [Aphelenchoides fujianensis]|nr:hypothetical protein M3Y99_01892400 [Aphelenchoides fujianensis]
MADQQETIYECGPDDDFEQIPSERESTEEAPVSYIKQMAAGRYLQHFFQAGPKGEDETLIDRYNRLRSELVLLHDRIGEEQLTRGESQSKKVVPVHSFLSAVNATERPKTEFVDPRTQRLILLEKRIAELEWTLGLDSAQPPANAPLLKTVEDLKTRIALLTPDIVQKIHKRIKENTQVNSARSDVSVEAAYPRDEKHSGIAEVHELVKRWDERCKELPNLVAHLAACRPLQQDAGRGHPKRQLNVVHAKRHQQRLNDLRQRVEALSGK